MPRRVAHVETPCTLHPSVSLTRYPTLRPTHSLHRALHLTVSPPLPPLLSPCFPGNPCIKGGAPVLAHGSGGLVCNVADSNDGRYTVTWSGTAKGYHSVHVTIDGAHVEGSPFTVRVDANELSPAHCEISGDLSGLVAGEPATVRMHCVDRYGNDTPPERLTSFRISMRRRSAELRGGEEDQRDLDDEIALKRLALLEREGGGAPGGAGNAGLSIIEAKWVAEGSYDIQFTCVVAGKYWLSLSCWKEPPTGGASSAERLPGGPYQFEVLPARPDAPASTLVDVRRAHMMTLVAGEELAFQVGRV